MIRRKFIQTFTTATVAISSFPSIILPKQKKKLGVALVGLGYYSTDLLAPALQLTQHCYLAGVVSGTPSKKEEWQKKYNLPSSCLYSYEQIYQIANNDLIDVIYIVLPTGLHAEYAIKAAHTGKHVWCEKPMARTESECQNIIDACNKNKVKLAIGYRMQHEKNTQTIIEFAKNKPYGSIQKLEAHAGYYDGRTDHWKLKKEMGGGAIYDMGVYTINGLRYASQEKPISVIAKQSTSRPDIFTEVDETTEFTFKFPSGAVGHGRTSFGENLNHLKVDCKKGWYELNPFQSYSGVQGRTSDGIHLSPSPLNQQAKQMDDDALAILNNSKMLVQGEDGQRDIRLVEAINRSAELGQEVKL